MNKRDRCDPRLLLHASNGHAAGFAHAPRRILIILAAGIGDFVMATPTLRAIREHLPAATIWILTIPEARLLAERCPYVDVVRTLDLRYSRSSLAWLLGRRRRELWELLKEFRHPPFDLVVNLYEVATRLGGLRMAAFLWAIRARLTVGRWSRGRAIGFDLASSEEVGHEIDAQLGVARLIGAIPVVKFPELWVTDKDRRDCTSLVKRYGITRNHRIVCVHAGSAQPEKRWPCEHFAVVGRRLSEAGAQVVIIGSNSERDVSQWLAEAVPGSITLAGATSLSELGALLERSTLLVTNDSGPMHMAAALGVPLVVPFGPGSPSRFGPRGRAECVVFSSPLASPGHPWWIGVQAATVAEAALRILAEITPSVQSPSRNP